MMKIRGINPIEKEMVQMLYNEETSLTISEMSQKLGRPETVVRKHALDLQQKGVIDLKSKAIREVQTDFNNLLRLYGLYENVPLHEKESFLNCLDPRIRQEIEVALQTAI